MITNGEVLIRAVRCTYVGGALHALNGVTTEIRKGEVVVIVGPSEPPESPPSAIPEPSGGSHQRTYLF